jgi:hypothetical protein
LGSSLGSKRCSILFYACIITMGETRGYAASKGNS